MVKKIVLAYSGGLDTSVILKWLQLKYNCSVATFTADLGQGDELEPIREKAESLGVKEIFIENLQEEFVKNYVFPMFRANTLYEGTYLLGTAIARPLIAKRQIEIAKKFGAFAVSHGATDKGNEMWGQVSCRPLSMEFTMKSPYLFEGIKSWKPAMECSNDALYRKVLADSIFRKNLLNEIEDDAQVRLFNGDWDKIIVREVGNKKFLDLEGLSIKDIAKQNNVNPLDWLLNHSLNEGGMDTLFIAMLLNSDEEAVGRLLRHPRSNITLSDAGAHLTFFNDAGYGLYMLEKWVREKKLMSKEKAIYNLTGKQADIYRIDQRGRLVPGQYADMMLIDFDKVGVSKTYRVNDLPGGSSRLNIDGHGIHSVWINGEKVFNENSIIDNKNLPGKVLRGFHA